YSINGLRTTGDVKLLLADGTVSTYAVDMDATADKFEDMADGKNTPIEQWWDEGEITSDNSMAAVLHFMGTDDTNEANVTTRGRASGNLIAYTIDEETEEVTFQPASLDGGNWVNGDSKTYTMATGNFF